MASTPACCVCVEGSSSGSNEISECVCDQIVTQECKVGQLWRKFQEMGKLLKNEDKSDSSSASSSVEDDSVPDGGWGWAVCFGSFLINFILDGTMFSFGVLLIELLDYFGQGKAKTSWIGSSLLGMSMFMGPVVSMLLERYTCRQITIAGTTLSVIAFIVSTFSPNVEVLIITYGILAGIGFSMSFIAAIIIVGTYFTRRRAIATGIAMSGSGLGTFAYAYLTNILLARYNWRGTVLILSGILLNGVVCGFLFRPISQTKNDRSKSEDISAEEAQMHEIKALLKKSPLESFRASNMPPRLSMSTEFTALHKGNMLLPESNKIKSFLSQHDFRKGMHPISNNMARKDIFYSGSLARLPHHRSAAFFSSHASNLNSTETEDPCKEKTHFQVFIEGMKKNIQLFRNNVFILLLLTNVCWTVQSVPLTYIPDLGISKGLPPTQAATLISIVGITNIFGRILSGIITDLFRIKSSVTYTVALFVASAVNFLMPWCEGFMALAACGAIFGLCMATAVSMRTIVLADHLGIDNLTQCFGMVALFQGIAFMTNAPIAGYLYESFSSYVLPFSFAGIMYLFSGIFCVAVQIVDRDSHRDEIEIVICDEKGEEK